MEPLETSPGRGGSEPSLSPSFHPCMIFISICSGATCLGSASILAPLGSRATTSSCPALIIFIPLSSPALKLKAASGASILPCGPPSIPWWHSAITMSPPAWSYLGAALCSQGSAPARSSLSPGCRSCCNRVAPSVFRSPGGRPMGGQGHGGDPGHVPPPKTAAANP